ncbi:MAG: hypothetical protein ACD_49C00056G0008 [uncultured bacterium (gcode 4)]|uniref:Uncharacterized protein n=1 Tax=uncultured bacterium (gcode 4) TaxID=1234023 RepID=K2BBV0_9BACT|nr:MAG: hypothetical protein ACD_49C00056G0008 [uncultured bacterium (gcode 4)]
MSDLLSSKLDEIQQDAEIKKSWFKFIYSLIESNLREYQGIFHTQEEEINSAKQIIFNELKRILEYLIDEEMRPLWIRIFTRKLNKLDENNMIIDIGFAEFKPITPRDEMERSSRIHILWNKKRDFKKWLLSIFKNEDEIEVTDDEIEYYINKVTWSHKLFLTQKWRDTINAYLRATWRDELDVIKEKVNETREKMLWIICSI